MSKGKGKAFEEIILFRADKLAERGILTLSRYGVKVAFLPGENGKPELKALPSNPDFDGSIAPNGRELIIEAKVCGESCYKVSNRSDKNPQQIDHMIDRARFGSLCYLMIHFTERHLVKRTDPEFTIALRVHPEEQLWLEFFNCGRKTIGREEARDFGIIVPWNQYSSRSSKASPDLTVLIPAKDRHLKQDTFRLS